MATDQLISAVDQLIDVLGIPTSLVGPDYYGRTPHRGAAMLSAT